METLKKCKFWCHSVLNFPYRKSAKVFNGILLFFVIISMAIIPIHLLKADSWNDSYLVFIEKIIVTIFSVEYVLRIWVSQNPFRYIFSLKGIIDLLAILPYYISLFIYVANPHTFILLRVLRILKFDEIFASYSREEHPEKELILHKSINIMPNEKVERVIQRHPIIFIAFSTLPLFIMTAAMLVLFMFPVNIWTISISVFLWLIALIAFFKNWLDQNYDIMLITSRRVIFQQREIFGAKSNSLNYESINNVIVDNVGLMRWIFGYGNVKIETANRDGTIDYYFAPQPEEIDKKVSANMHMAKAKIQSRL